MNESISILDIVGRVSTVVVVISLLTVVFLWIKGVLPVLYRLGNGLVKRKIAIFAKGDHLVNLKGLLLDSGLFNKKNIIEITSINDFGKHKKSTVFLVFWWDWEEQKDREGILELRKNSNEVPLVIYAPLEKNKRILDEDFEKINLERYASVSNLRGRLLNDIVSYLITTSCTNK